MIPIHALSFTQTSHFYPLYLYGTKLSKLTLLLTLNILQELLNQQKLSLLCLSGVCDD